MRTVLAHLTRRCRQLTLVTAALIVAAILPPPAVFAQDVRPAARFRIDPGSQVMLSNTTLVTRRQAQLSWAESWYAAAPPLPPNRKPASRGTYALWGAVIGGIVGFGVGKALIPEWCGDGCWAPPITYPASGLVVGAAVGTLIGLIAHSWAVESSDTAK
jgi:hypothetical protein